MQKFFVISLYFSLHSRCRSHFPNEHVVKLKSLQDNFPKKERTKRRYYSEAVRNNCETPGSGLNGF